MSEAVLLQVLQIVVRIGVPFAEELDRLPPIRETRDLLHLKGGQFTATVRLRHVTLQEVAFQIGEFRAEAVFYVGRKMNSDGHNCSLLKCLLTPTDVGKGLLLTKIPA
jgi:hypothetical protein